MLIRNQSLMLRIWDNSTNASMSLWIPYGIPKRIIPLPLGSRDKLHYARFTTALCAWYNSSNKFQFTLFLKLGSHYQRVSLLAHQNSFSILAE